MHIIHILQGKANPETLNGVNKAVHYMATYQARLGHDVEVWGLVAQTNLPPHPREYALRLFSVTRLRVTLGKELKFALNRLDSATWVHFHSVFIPEFPAIARLLCKRGLSFGITPHGGYASGVINKNPWKKRAYIALREAQYLRRAVWVQALGESEIGDIMRIAPMARVTLIPNGQESIPLPVATGQYNAERPLLGYCGRLSAQHKGLDLLIAGFASYKKIGGLGELWLVGDGEDRAWLEGQAAQKGVRAYVRFLGTKYDAQKLTLIASFDAFIHCSRWDGLPTACLEAAALGRPLLVSRETNLAGYIERCCAGLVLDETSAAGVQRVLQQFQQLYNNHLHLEMGRNARLLVASDFNWEENAKSFIAAIRAATSSVQ